MKLAKLIDQGFQGSVRLLMKQPLPIKTAYQVRGVIKRIEEELTKYEEFRKEALQKFGKKKEDGSLELDEHNNVQFEEGKMQLFMKELSELADIDVDMPKLIPGDLGNDLFLSAEDLINLEGLLVN